ERHGAAVAPEPTSTPPQTEAGSARPARPAAARLRRAVDAAAARPWPWLVAVTVAATVAQLLARPTWLGSWYFARLGVHTLLSPVGLHLYALHPQLQMGPLTFVVCAPFVLLGGAIGRPAAMVMMLLAGLIAVG